MKKKLLLHTCCAPCSTHCIKELQKDYDVTLYFYNPNIHPYGEFVKRLQELDKVTSALKVLIVEGTYDAESWVEQTKGLETEPEGGKRCRVCFQMRLDKTADFAKENDFDCFTTTMTISPFKDEKIINSIGEELALKYGLEWVYSDFKKDGGYKKSVENSKELGLYRQKYCGCFYSVKNNIASPKE
jgi:predicted adenine nucleotide alpha hydrolase (AANH) superfamily ATPase